MKIKKNIEDLKKEQENVSDVMQELSDDVMDQVSGRSRWKSCPCTTA